MIFPPHSVNLRALPRRLLTYDIAFAGPRNRFTVVSSAGPIIVHNCGYGSGGDKIRATLRNKAKINLSPEEGVKARDAYRDTHPAVVNLWKEGGRMLSALAGSGVDRQWGPCKIADQRLWLPNGIPLNYETLDYYRGDPEYPSGYWRLRTRNGWTKMYGAKLVQNLIQALARVIVTQAMLRIRAHGYRIVNMRHDDLWILIPRDGREDEHMNICLVEMCRSPAWLPELPLGAEATMGPSYGVGKKFVYGA